MSSSWNGQLEDDDDDKEEYFEVKEPSQISAIISA